MTLALSEEQELLRDTAQEFVKERSPVTSLRELRDNKDDTGFSRDLWKEMAELGWVGVTFPELGIWQVQHRTLRQGFIGFGGSSPWHKEVRTGGHPPVGDESLKPSVRKQFWGSG